MFRPTTLQNKSGMEPILNPPFGIDVTEATLAYGEKVILDRASLAAHAGDVVGLLGSNGAGKSTFFDILCGIKPAATLITASIFTPEDCVYLSQTITTPAALKMSEIADMVELLSDETDGSSMRHRREELIGPHKIARFVELGKKRSGICSYGEKRWFITMCLLALDRSIYILDEPTSGVDPEYRFYIWQAVEVLRRRQKTILVSSHLVGEIADNCGYFYFLVNGKFTRYADGLAFMTAFECDSLDAAFIRAAQCWSPAALG